MVSPLPVCNVLIDNFEFIPTLLDSGCAMYALVSEEVAARLQLRRIEIRPMKFSEAVKKKEHIRYEKPRSSTLISTAMKEIYGHM